MSGGHEAKSHSSGSGEGISEIVEGFTMGMFELFDSSGGGLPKKGTVERGGGSHGGGHKSHAKH